MKTIFLLISLSFSYCLYSQTGETPCDYQKSSDYRKQGKEMFAEENYSAAVSLFSKSIEVCPENGEVYFSRLSARLADGKNLDSVTIDFDNLIELQLRIAESKNKEIPKGSIEKLYVYRGIVNYANGDFLQAIEDIERLEFNKSGIEVNKNFYEPYILGGNAAYAAKKISRAIEFYNEAFEAVTHDKNGIYIGGKEHKKYYVDVNQDSMIAKLTGLIERKNRSTPDYAAYGWYMYRGEAKARINDYKGALLDFKK